MSVLADMLKKADAGRENADIPPGMVEAARSGILADKRRARLLLWSAVGVAAIAAGCLLVLVLAGRRAVRPLPQAVPVAPAPLPAAVVQKPISAVAPLPRTEQPKPAVAQQQEVRPKQALRPRRVVAASSRAAGAAVAPPAAQAPADAPKPAPPRDRAAIDALLFAARSAEAQQDYPAALRSYRKALEADPDNYRVMNNLAGVYLKLGMAQEALLAVNQALQVRPEYVAALVNGGIAQVRLGNAAVARDLFKRALTHEPGNRAALQNLGLLFERTAAWDEALATYRRLLESGDPQGQLGLGRVYERRGQRQEALRAYRDLIGMPEAGARLREQARERIAVLEQ